jgi:hypothetical protein
MSIIIDFMYVFIYIESSILDIEGAHMSFREKIAWTTLLAMAGIYGLYFWSVVHPGAGFRFGGLLGTIVVLIVVQIVLAIAIAIVTPKEATAPPDERDRLIDLRATRVAYAGLASGIALACFFGAVAPRLAFDMNALLFILVAAEILRCTCQIVQYRRSA